MKFLADTHILIWWFEDKTKLSPQIQNILSALSAREPLLVSSISLWEIATLISLKRISIDRPLANWLQELIAPPLVHCIGITPHVAEKVASLPDSFHRDPADRIIVATSMLMNADLLTVDDRIIESNLVKTIS